MPRLADLQRGFRRALLESVDDGIAGLVREDGLAPSERLDIYRNNVTASLTSVLKEIFPAVCRLVDERFFDYAAHAFITAQPPRQARLSEYGEGFSGFLAQFPPSQHLEYLPDVARLEWLMHAAAHAAEAAPLAATALQGVAAEDSPRLTFRLHPALGLAGSRFPIDEIWEKNRPDGESDEPVDLDSGGVFLEVSRRGHDVVYRSLFPADFAFRNALALGQRLEAATEAALAVDSSFDLTRAFADFFRDEAVIGFDLAPETAAR